MKLKVRCLDLDAGGKTVAILNKRDAEELGVYSLDRIKLKIGKREVTAITNTSEKFVKKGEIAIYNEIRKGLKVKDCLLYTSPSPRD